MKQQARYTFDEDVVRCTLTARNRAAIENCANRKLGPIVTHCQKNDNKQRLAEFELRKALKQFNRVPAVHLEKIA